MKWIEENRSKIETAAVVIPTALTIINHAKDYRDQWKQRKVYTASVDSSEFIYRPLSEWIDKQVHTRTVKFSWHKEKIRRFYDGQGSVALDIKGRKFIAAMSKREPEPQSQDMFDSVMSSSLIAPKLTLQTYDNDGLDALQEFLGELAQEEMNRDREVCVYSPYNNSYWNGSEFAYRDIDSVFLPVGVKEDLLGDIDNFLANESRYHSIGAPWHRGYMLHGEPGNGKSSMVAAIAHHYKMPVYSLSLGNVKNDSQLTQLISTMDAGSILLIEDIDIFSKSMKREQEDSSVTLAGLLNALDGINTPNGMLTFITTNHVETLDPALIRPGRIDYRLELKSPVESQIEGMFKHVYGESLNVQPKEFNSMSELANIFKLNLDDAESARVEIKAD